MATIHELITSGHVTVAGSKLIALCQKCGKVITLNKPIIGSLHVCTGEDN